MPRPNEQASRSLSNERDTRRSGPDSATDSQPWDRVPTFAFHTPMSLRALRRRKADITARPSIKA
ncbi:uncharacterized protein BDZ83DRAFT_617195 [Colletotrichum acutatum]|uniref:Uncharacterized protein n=1 Tax=Glomerella acutata TaxID=27357 RepID=A0AAD8UTN1_GLOAC|nr:uncharacterized protein BDZ83DRAFT_617195 [Colletotrichum acutatum]KAK1726115.1 hypothetical protein BDZ83DRAFT_617195 [Colletotrichum acutatum]